jgi:phage baseplate assembly protein W
MAQQPIDVFYKDFDIVFSSHPVTRKLNTLTNSDAIKRSLKNIILTDKLERPYNPEFGSDIRQRLFETHDGTVADDIASDIEFAVKNFEPRVKLLDVRVEERIEENGVMISIVFRAQNKTATETVNFFVERIR